MASTVVQMPQLGESVVEGTIGRWLKQPGERVERDEPLVEIQTDKVNAEVPSPVAGVLQQVLLPEGATVAVKTDIAIIGDEALPAGAAPAAAPPAAEAEAGADVSGLALADAASGSAPSDGEPAASRASLANGADTVRGEPSPPPFRYDDAAAGGGGPTSSARAQTAESTAASAGPISSAPQPPDAPSAPAAEGAADTGRRRFYTPVVLRLAQEHGIDLESVAGSGLGGRVTRRDVEQAIASGKGGAAPAPVPTTWSASPAAAPRGAPGVPGQQPPTGAQVPAAAAATQPATAPAPPAEDRALTPMRRAIADHMARARADIPDAWSMVEIDVTRLVRQRAALLADWQAREGYELTYLPFFVKAVLAGLRAVPELNATWAGDHITLHRRYDLGIAVSIEQGLVVPVLRGADGLSVTGLARALRALVQKARAGRLAAEDLQGATFTVNNPGSLGSILSQPVVPLGQAGIVTMEAIVKRPVVTADDAIGVRSMMNACLSFDHRILDGAQALHFLRALKEQLESGE
ncbi:MAG: 2-oxo acid dehydrogenase subunit E2 [Chloroflexi bacterium]|nr:2-oxo acid dehydrogenase subunit E2 [Chloroflexota bacterium]